MDRVSKNPGRYLAGVFTLRIMYFYMHVLGLLFGSQQLDICNIFLVVPYLLTVPHSLGSIVSHSIAYINIKSMLITVSSPVLFVILLNPLV
jgi:hypothetical protein